MDTRTKELLKDPCTSYWLQAALEGSLLRDPVDALADAEKLVSVLKERLEKLSTNSVDKMAKSPPLSFSHKAI